MKEIRKAGRRDAEKRDTS